MKQLSMVLCLALIVAAGASSGGRYVGRAGTGDTLAIRAWIDSAGVAAVAANMCTVQQAFEEYAMLSYWVYPTDAASTTPDGRTVEDLLPDIDNDGAGDWPINPFTGQSSVFTWNADPHTAGDMGANPADVISYRIKGCDGYGNPIPFELTPGPNTHDEENEARVVAGMLTVQRAFDEFAAQSGGMYPACAADTTPGGQTTEELCPDTDFPPDGNGDWPINPFTRCNTVFSWYADPCSRGDIGDNPAYVEYYVIKGCGRDSNLLPLELTPGSGPVAHFIAEPLSGISPLQVSFTDTSSGDFDNWHWDFGNGNQFDGRNPPTQTYETELCDEEFTAVLTVTGAGVSGVHSTVIHAQTPVQASFTFEYAPPSEPGSPDVHFTDGSTCEPDAWLWDFGDGSNSADQNPEHVFPSEHSQDFQVTLAVARDGVCFGQEIQVVSVSQPGASVPQPVGFTTGQGLIEICPNPFSATTAIEYELSDVGPVRLQMYDTRGRLVRTLVNGTGQGGRSQAEWNGLDDLGQPVAPGFYFCRLCSNGRTQTARIILAK